MRKSPVKYTEEQQEQIDEGWRLFNRAMGACEELEGFLHDLGEDLGIDVSRANDAAGDAWSSLENVYSYGASILPKHSGDM